MYTNQEDLVISAEDKVISMTEEKNEKKDESITV